VAFKVITGMRCPDHSTIAEFRRRHQDEIAELFDDVLGLCQEAGLVSVGVITIDGSKMKASASMDQNRSYRGLVREILREAEETDRAEDELYGREHSGDELPEPLRTAEGRKRALADAKARIEERKAKQVNDEPVAEMTVAPEVTVLSKAGRRGGRREWLRTARRQLEEHRSLEQRPVPRDRDDRRFQALGRLEENLRVELAANDAYEHWRATSRDIKGRVMKGNHKPFLAPEEPEGQINLSDPDSRVMRTQGMPPRQAYNAQAAVNDRQVILAEIVLEAADFGQLGPMFKRTLENLERHGVSEPPGAVIADAGYWNTAQIQTITEKGVEVLVPPDGAMREGKRPGWEDGPYQEMRDKLTSEDGRKLYAKRKITIEPVYGQIKYNRGITEFMRRGRSAVQSEWRLVAATHNLLKLHSHWTANTA
jgi:hypothetical protein